MSCRARAACCRLHAARLRRSAACVALRHRCRSPRPALKERGAALGLRANNPMCDDRAAPSFKGLGPASEKASAAARGASAKTNTRCEIMLRRELWRRGLRYRLHAPGLPGRPDIVFMKQRVAVFCDGDFWHGRNLNQRLAKLAEGHNAKYWLAKVRNNTERDRCQTEALRASGWTVLSFWETDILSHPTYVADQINAAVQYQRLQHRGSGYPST